VASVSRPPTKSLPFAPVASVSRPPTKSLPAERVATPAWRSPTSSLSGTDARAERLPARPFDPAAPSVRRDEPEPPSAAGLPGDDGDPPDESAAEELESSGEAWPIAGVVATAAATPRATANAPMRPMYLAYPIGPTFRQTPHRDALRPRCRFAARRGTIRSRLTAGRPGNDEFFEACLPPVGDPTGVDVSAVDQNLAPVSSTRSQVADRSLNFRLRGA